MCNPTALVITAQVIGSGISAVGAIRQANAAAAESRFRSDIAANNAQIANRNAQIALDKGEADIADKRRLTNQRIGLQRAQLAAMGFDVSSGSSVDILADTATLGELDVLRIDADAENRATNFRNQSTDFSSEAQLGRFAAKNQKTTGRLRAGGSLITGAGRAGTTFLNRKP